MFHGHLDCIQKPSLGGRSKTKPGDHGTLDTHNHWLILFYHVWGPAWIEIHWNSIWLWAWSHMISHYTWGSVITLHDFGGVLGWPSDTFFWALTMSWSRLLARVWSGPKPPLKHVEWVVQIQNISGYASIQHRNTSDTCACVIWLGVDLKPDKKKKKTCVQKWLGDLYDHLMTTKIFTLIMSRIFIWAPKNMRQMTTGTISIF